jgi:hypothetical protein
MKPNQKLLRALAVALGILGTLLGGFLFGLFLCDPHGTGPIEGPPTTMWIWFTPFPVLLWYGLWLRRQALYCLVLVPTPVILASGIYLASAGSPSGRWILVLGMAASIASGLLVSSHYGRSNLKNEERA